MNTIKNNALQKKYPPNTVRSTIFCYIQTPPTIHIGVLGYSEEQTLT
jgi:hypothetical protein